MPDPTAHVTYKSHYQLPSIEIKPGIALGSTARPIVEL